VEQLRQHQLAVAKKPIISADGRCYALICEWWWQRHGNIFASFDAYRSPMESCQIDAGKRPFRSAIANGKLLPGIDGRGRLARRFRDVTEALTRELRTGEALSTAQTALIRQAALIIVQTEEMQLAAARGDAIDPDDVVRLSAIALRILSKLERSRRKTDGARPLRERLLRERGQQ
jgi:hypothetical protein